MEVMKRGFGAERETEKKKKIQRLLAGKQGHGASRYPTEYRCSEVVGGPRLRMFQQLHRPRGVGLHMTWCGRAPGAKIWRGKEDGRCPGVLAVIPLLALVELSMLPSLGSQECPVVFTDKHTHGN